MRVRTPILPFSATAMIFAGIAHSQMVRPGVGPTSPNAQNQQLETMQQIRLLDEQRRLEAQRQHDAQVAKFMKAIKPRRDRFPDFDQVVIRSKTPITPDMLAWMVGSPYAADIAYYLGKHQDQSKAIALMGATESGAALRQIESAIAAQDTAIK